MKKLIISSVTLFTLLLIMILGRPLGALYELAWDIPQFIKYNGDIADIEDSDSRLAISEIHNSIPLDSEIQYDSTSQSFGNYTKYHIYPTTLEPISGENFSSDYFICNSNNYKNNNSYTYFKKLKSGHFLYSKFSFANKKVDSLIWNIVCFIFFISVVFLFGFLILSLISINLRLKIMYSFLVGYTIVNSVQFIFLTLFSIHPTRVLFLFYSLLTIFFCFKAKCIIKNDFTTIISYVKTAFYSLVKFNKNQRFWFFLVPSFGVFVLFSIHIFITPVWSGDAIAFWMLKAKVLANEGVQFNRIIQNEYPIFWPQFNSIIFDLQGSLNDYPLKWLVFVLLFNLSLIVFFVSRNSGIYLRSFMLFLFYAFYAHATLRSTFAETIFFLFTFFIASIYANKDQMNKIGNSTLLIIGFIGLSLSKMEGAYQFIIIAIAYHLFSKFEIKHFFLVTSLLVGYFIFQSHWTSFVFDKGWDISAHFNEGLSLTKVKVWLQTILMSGHGALFPISVGFGIPIMIFLCKPNVHSNRLQSFFITAAFGTVLFSVLSILGWDTERIQRSSESATVRMMLHSFPLLIMFMYEALNGNAFFDGFGSEQKTIVT